MFILIKAQPSKISTQHMAISNAIPAFRLKPAMLFSHFSGLHHSVPLRCWLCVIPLLKGGKVVATKVNKVTCRKQQLSHSLWGLRCKNNSMRIEVTKKHICSGCRIINIIYMSRESPCMDEKKNGLLLHVSARNAVAATNSILWLLYVYVIFWRAVSLPVVHPPSSWV